ncbi:MAG: EAL domain-containing protein [Burkholderiales bacterium]|nr:EAL domain-containing protein [Burkholderiales bacterium]
MAAAPILIVDDEPSNLATLKQILEGDYQLAFARSGAECLAAARKHQPALILLDIRMPDMDGYAVCRKLKADPATESIPVIFVSALGEVGDETAGFESGGVDYIVKPVSPAIVHARVRTHLSLVRATILEHYVRQLEIEQAKTARLSRIHAVLSGTNSAIVRVREPQALFEEACHIAVNQGGFGIAWIGMSADNGKLLKLTACQGVTAERLGASLFLAKSAAALEPGMVGQVLNIGKAVVCNDVRYAGDCGLTCRDVLERGYLSVVCLPLIAMEKVVGVMALYAREAHYFDDDELKLLNELAGDISFALQAIENEKRASFLSYYDALTALPNTDLFFDRLKQLVQAAARESSGVFVIALNLNRFKELNDAVGRHVGDQVLRMVGQRLSKGITRPCTVARIGADNFAVMGEQNNSQEVSALCEQILGLLNEALVIDDKQLQVSARLGIAIYPSDSDDAEALFKNAEAALKQAKYVKARYLFYSPEINARVAEKLAMENMLKTALENKQFVLHFQPKVDLSSGQIIGAEALIRWQHPERGMIPPVEFIPLAEESGLIVPIGAWVIRTVCAAQVAWRKDHIPIVPVALNLSALQFKENDILEFVGVALAEHGLEPGWLDLELTESLVMQNLEDAEKIMHAFHEMGLHLSLDDFGTGYSSLAYLKRFPFDTVKIDRAFVIDITRNPEDAAIASAIIGMAHSLRMRVVAEGVETEAQLKFLRNKHCDQIQGYFFSRPVPAQEFGTMLGLGKRLELEPDSDAEQQTLLIVEEDKEMLSGLQQSLRGQGYRIVSAGSSEQALELLATTTVQVMLCGQRMSKIAGADFITIVARLYPATMRIVLNGQHGLQSALNAINRGEVYRVHSRPWDEDLLRQNIREAFLYYRSTV